MAAGLFRVNARTVLTPGAFTQAGGAESGTTAWDPGTGSNANAAGNWGSGNGTPGGGGPGSSGIVYNAGQLIYVDPAGALGVALGGGANLTAVSYGQETGGGYGTGN